jgi:hypothetical protein
MTRVPLPIAELRKLRVGDKFVVYWAKDDDPERVRCNYETQTVAEVTEDGIILTTNDYDWAPDGDTDLDGNVIDTSRGYAYFYRA